MSFLKETTIIIGFLMVNVPVFITMLIFGHLYDKNQKQIEDGIEKNRAFKRTKAGKDLLRKRKIIDILAPITTFFVMSAYLVVVAILFMHTK